jgi:hypothetical protein
MRKPKKTAKPSNEQLREQMSREFGNHPYKWFCQVLQVLQEDDRSMRETQGMAEMLEWATGDAYLEDIVQNSGTDAATARKSLLNMIEMLPAMEAVMHRRGTAITQSLGAALQKMEAALSTITPGREEKP